ncbi:MAG: transposase [Brucella anthropi]
MVARQRVIAEEQKLDFVRRIEAGENVSRLADEIGISRQRLYEWREQLRVRGNLKSLRRGRPARSAERTDGTVPHSTDVLPLQEKALSKARRRIKELEQKVGQQQLDLDFFQEALRYFEEDRRQNSAFGGTGSSRSSKG